MLSERLSVALSRCYLDQFGLILHHNVDKALLAAGQSEPSFGAGRIIEPMRIFLSKRATTVVQGKSVPVRELAEECAHAWFRENMHAMDTETGIQHACLVRPGSSDLVDLFVRQRDADVYLGRRMVCWATTKAVLVRLTRTCAVDTDRPPICAIAEFVTRGYTTILMSLLATCKTSQDGNAPCAAEIQRHGAHRSTAARTTMTYRRSLSSFLKKSLAKSNSVASFGGVGR